MSMKICLFADAFLPKIGGMELVIHYLGNALVEEGADVTVIAKYFPGTWEFDHKYRLVQYGNRFPGSGRTGADFLAGVGTLIARHRRHAYDVVNCHGVAYAGRRGAWARRFVSVPVVMTPHGDDLFTVPEIGLGMRLDPRWDGIIRQNLAAADAITAISSSMRQQLDFVPPERVFDVPNGIQLQRFAPGKSDYLHQRFSLKTEQKIVLSLGRKSAQKAFEDGIRAFGQLVDRGTCPDLVLVIGGKNVPSLQPLVSSLQLDDHVYLMPEQPPEIVMQCYQSAWCFFSSSIIEGMSLVSIEAMAVGLPLVLTDVPGNQEILEQVPCGILVDSKNHLSMATGLEKMYLDANAYQEFARRAVAGARGYDWRNIAQKYLSVYDGVVSKHQ